MYPTLPCFIHLLLQVLGRNIDKAEDVVFDERKKSVQLTTDHPQTAQEARDDIKGSK